MRWLFAVALLVACGGDTPEGTYTLTQTRVNTFCTTLPDTSTLEIMSSTYVEIDGHGADAIIEPVRRREDGDANVQFSLTYSESMCCFEGRPYPVTREKTYRLWGDASRLEGDADARANTTTCQYTVLGER